VSLGSKEEAERSGATRRQTPNHSPAARLRPRTWRRYQHGKSGGKIRANHQICQLLELSALLGGRKVDLNTPLCLSRFFRDEVLAEAEPVYAAA